MESAVQVGFHEGIPGFSQQLALNRTLADFLNEHGRRHEDINHELTRHIRLAGAMGLSPRIRTTREGQDQVMGFPG